MNMGLFLVPYLPVKSSTFVKCTTFGESVQNRMFTSVFQILAYAKFTSVLLTIPNIITFIKINDSILN